MTENLAQTMGLDSLRHMAWANSKTFEILCAQPDQIVQLTSNFDDWSVARIAHHTVTAARGLVARASETEMPAVLEIPQKTSDFVHLAQELAVADSQLLDLAQQPDRELRFTLRGEVRSARVSVVLMQAVHHAHEHRVQIAGILASHGHNVVNLDELSHWKFHGVE